MGFGMGRHWSGHSRFGRVVMLTILALPGIRLSLAQKGGVK